jgi:hypothetical protein
LSNIFDDSLKAIPPGHDAIKGATIDVLDTAELVRKWFDWQRVKYTAADIIAAPRLIIERLEKTEAAEDESAQWEPPPFVRRERKPPDPVRSARAKAYWTPERRATQWAHAKAHSTGADAYNAVMAATNYRDADGARKAHEDAYRAALKALLESPEFLAKVAQKRADMNKATTRRKAPEKPIAATPFVWRDRKTFRLADREPPPNQGD